jgi:hypothetical protein
MKPYPGVKLGRFRVTRSICVTRDFDAILINVLQTCRATVFTQKICDVFNCSLQSQLNHRHCRHLRSGSCSYMAHPMNNQVFHNSF